MLRIDTGKLGKILITGGTGFIGSHLAKSLVDKGEEVRVYDNGIRGSIRRIRDCAGKIDYREGDVTDFDQVLEATKGIDTVFHLAAINGTENFYRFPEKVLEVGVKGVLNTIEAAMKCGVSKYVVASSSEVYQEPNHVPTAEDERIIIPDIRNPRFSYSGTKIVAELLALHYAKKGGLRTVIFRPHNVYGPDMGVGHVIPQFILRMKTLSRDFTVKAITFPIQGDGSETRSFCYVDDAVDEIILCASEGENREIYHIGQEEEISISDLAREIAASLGLRVELEMGPRLEGGTKRRCPSIEKIRALGYRPRVFLKDGLRKTVAWYIDESNMRGPLDKGDIIQ